MVHDASKRTIDNIKTIRKIINEHDNRKQFENLKWVGGNRPLKSHSANLFQSQVCQINYVPYIL
jgi:hypothetical protein